MKIGVMRKLNSGGISSVVIFSLLLSGPVPIRAAERSSPVRPVSAEDNPLEQLRWQNVHQAVSENFLTPEMLGKLIIFNDWVDFRSKPLYDTVRGEMYLKIPAINFKDPALGNNEAVMSSLTRDLTNRLSTYEDRIKEIKAGKGGVQVEDVLEALKNTTGVGIQTGGLVATANRAASPYVAGGAAGLAGGYYANVLLEKQNGYNDAVGKWRLGYDLSRNYGRVGASTQHYEDLVGRTVEKLKLSPALQGLFDLRLNHDMKNPWQVRLSVADNVKLQLKTNSDQYASISHDDSPVAVETKKALQTRQQMLNLQLSVIKNPGLLDHHEIATRFNDLFAQTKRTIDRLTTDAVSVPSDSQASVPDRQTQEKVRELQLNGMALDAMRSSAQSLADVAYTFGGTDGRKMSAGIKLVVVEPLKFGVTLLAAKAIAAGGTAAGATAAGTAAGATAAGTSSAAAAASSLMIASGAVALAAGVIMGLAALLDSGNDDEILKQIAALREQLQKMHQEMREQFALVHEHLNVVFDSLIKELVNIEKTQSVNQKALAGILLKLGNLSDELLRSALNNRELIRALAERIKLRPFLPELVERGAHLRYDEYQAGIKNLFDCATKDAFDPIETGKDLLVGSSEEAVRSTLSRTYRERAAKGEEWKYKDIGTFLGAVEILHSRQSPALTAGAGDPLRWLYCARLYVMSLNARPAFYQRYVEDGFRDSTVEGPDKTYQIKKLIEAGETIHRTFRSVSPDLLLAALRDYKNGLDEMERGYLGHGGRSKWFERDLGIGENILNLQSVNPWLPVSKQTENTLKNFGTAQGILKACSNQDVSVWYKEGPNPDLTFHEGVKKAVLQDLVRDHKPFVVSSLLTKRPITYCYEKDWEETRDRREFPLGNTLVSEGKLTITIKAIYSDEKDSPHAIYAKTIRSPDHSPIRKHILNVRLLENYQPSEIPRLWNDDLSKRFAKDAVDNLRKEEKSEVGKLASALEGKLNGTLEELRYFIHAKERDVMHAGGDDPAAGLHTAANHVDSARAILDLLVTHRFPDSSQKDPMLRILTAGFLPLPQTATEKARGLRNQNLALPGSDMILDGMFESKLISIDLEAAKLELERVKKQEPPVPEDQIKEKQIILMWVRLVNELLDYTRDIRRPERAKDMMDKLGIKPKQLEALNNNLSRKQLTGSQLAQVKLIALYKALILERLSKRGYSEQSAEMKGMLDTLRFVERNFDLITSQRPVEGNPIKPQPQMGRPPEDVHER